MSQYQRQRLSEADFAQEVKEYYTAKKPYDELISKMPMIPGDKEGSSDKAPNSLQSAANAAGAQTKATAQDHKATPGPVIADNLPEPASKEELKKRAEELNKK